ncbi:ATP-binding protein [Nocardioides sp.]|uniref:ATP-binding protein n=1 Tax=Nocardioides sp. TaxID=35761 RepID=UPI00272153A9|nr:ATP-binding protein [Nocardioides sp.]MDO9455178.1 ATP-binding protein [Nocardioides sp.]
MLPSPYTPGETPTVLVGREEQLERARADLSMMATYGRFLGRVQVDIGSRGVGKTSLLKAVRDAAAQSGAVVVWVTARGDESLVAGLTHGLLRALEGLGVDVGPRTPLRERFQSVSLELGALGASAGVEVDVQPRRTPGSGAASTAFAELVSAAAIAARERGSAGVALLVDEVQAAPREDLRTLAYAWQELQQSTPEPPAVVFAVGLPNAPDVLTAAVTFSERFAFRTLQRLSAVDAAEVLEGPARAHRVTWEPELAAEVVRIADGYPYFLQLYADALWRVVGPDEGAVLPLDALDRARPLVADELDTMFRARWSKAAPGERRLLVALAELTDDRESPVRRGAIADRMGVTSNDLSEPRRSLLDKGLVEAADRGTLRFTVPGFAAFVRAESAG